MNSVIHFLVNSSGPQPVSYFDSNFRPLERVVRINGYPHGVLQELLAAVCRRAEQEGTSFQVIHHCLDNSMQGVILPERSAGIYGFDAYDPDEPSLLAALGSEPLKSVQENISAARETFRQARAFHDRQETIYLKHMDFDKANLITEQTIARLLGEKSAEGPGAETHRFFGAATADGNLDYIPEVTADLPRRYFVKGRPGTGKSTFLKKIAAAARERGFAVETYHCSLDPKSLDLIAVRELGFCLMDSTAPHEYFPSRDGDEIIDLYRECVVPGTDEAYAQELGELQKSYKSLVAKAIDFLKQAKASGDRFEASLPQLEQGAVDAARATAMAKLFA